MTLQFNKLPDFNMLLAGITYQEYVNYCEFIRYMNTKDERSVNKDINNVEIQELNKNMDDGCVIENANSKKKVIPEKRKFISVNDTWAKRTKSTKKRNIIHHGTLKFINYQNNKVVANNEVITNNKVVANNEVANNKVNANNEVIANNCNKKTRKKKNTENIKKRFAVLSEDGKGYVPASSKSNSRHRNEK